MTPPGERLGCLSFAAAFAGGVAFFAFYVGIAWAIVGVLAKGCRP